MPEENIKSKIETKIDSVSKKNEIVNFPGKSIESNIENPEKSNEDSETRSIVSEKISEHTPGTSTNGVQTSGQPRVKRLENILENDLADVYLKLSPNQRIDFKRKGEEISKRINILLDEAKVKTKKILTLIKEWLGMIPGVNKFFLEQLAKNKLDEIVKLKNK